jgi:uncharacterized protein YcbX
MPRTLLRVVLAGGIQLAAAPGLAVDPVARGPERASAVSDARVSAISGNQVTIADGAGRTRVLELEAVRGIVVGTPTGWCEEENCRTLRIGGEHFQVRRVVPARRPPARPKPPGARP